MKNNVLNDLTARYVMGWTKGKFVVNRGGKTREISMYFKRNGKPARPFVEWNPATKADHSLMLVEKLKDKTRFFDCGYDPALNQWSAEFGTDFLYHNEVYARTCEQAICLAALRSVNVRLKDYEEFKSIAIPMKGAKWE